MHKFNSKNLDRLISPERYQKVNPHKLLTEFGLTSGMVAADVGCGPGFFTFPMAEIVGPEGKVYAWDISQQMLDHLKKRNPPENVIIALSEENCFPTEDYSVDFVLLANLLHEVKSPALFLHEVKRVLKPHGRVVNWDWVKTEDDHGPPTKARISLKDAVRSFKKTGFSVLKAQKKSNSHYVIITEHKKTKT